MYVSEFVCRTDGYVYVIRYTLAVGSVHTRRRYGDGERGGERENKTAHYARNAEQTTATTTRGEMRFLCRTVLYGGCVGFFCVNAGARRRDG